MNVKNNKRKRDSIDKIEKAFINMLQSKEFLLLIFAKKQDLTEAPSMPILLMFMTWRTNFVKNWKQILIHSLVKLPTEMPKRCFVTFTKIRFFIKHTLNLVTMKSINPISTILQGLKMILKEST